MWVGSILLIGSLAVDGWRGFRNGSVEKEHANWQHVASASGASDAEADTLIQVDAVGNRRAVPSIIVSQEDVNWSASQRLRAALQADDLISATAALQSAQRIPTASANPDVQPPQMVAASEMATALEQGRRELYEIELFDCCEEDGDSVEVIVNGALFATIPITQAGSLLSVPLQQGPNVLTIRGVEDGGGGITLSFRTSRGDYFARAMQVGETYPIEVLVQ